MNIFRSSNLVWAIRFVRFSEVSIWIQFSLRRITVKALCGIPLFCRTYIRDTKCSLLKDLFSQSLTKVFGLSELVISTRFHILYSLLDNHGFRECIISSFSMNRLTCTIHQLLLSVAKCMVIPVQIPIVTSISLLTGCKVSMSLSIHGSICVFLFFVTTRWIQKILWIFRKLCWSTERNFASFSLVGPVIFTLVTFGKRFTNLWGIFAFFDIIKLVS